MTHLENAINDAQEICSTLADHWGGPSDDPNNKERAVKGLIMAAVMCYCAGTKRDSMNRKKTLLDGIGATYDMFVQIEEHGDTL